MYTFLMSYFFNFAATFLACKLDELGTSQLMNGAWNCMFAASAHLVLAMVRKERVIWPFSYSAPALVNLNM